MTGHLMGAGDPGAAAIRRQRQQDARRRNTQRAKGTYCANCKTDFGTYSGYMTHHCTG